MTALPEADLGKWDLCPGGCGTMVRRFPNVPISGSGLDSTPSGPWWCTPCLQKKTKAAADEVRARRPLDVPGP